MVDRMIGYFMKRNAIRFFEEGSVPGFAINFKKKYFGLSNNI